MDLSIIIVNYNTGHIISRCLDNVLAQVGINAEVLVIDNASTDSSITILSTYQDKIKLIPSKENDGFGKAINLVFPDTKGRYLFLLNPDAFLKQPDALQRLVSHMDQHPEHGIVGAKLAYTQGRGMVNVSENYPLEHTLTRPLSPLPGQIAWVFGASMAIRRNVFAAIKGFDEDYFVYGEDADICLRARQAGYSIGYTNEIVIDHIGGASENDAPQYGFRSRRQRSLYLFYQKHYSEADTIRLIKRDLRSSMLKKLLYRIEYWLTRSCTLARRVEKHQAIIDTSREFLTKAGNRG